MATRSLTLQSAIGFSGDVPHSLLLHPTDKYIIYPLGSTVVIRSVADSSQQSFLQAHSQSVTCMAMSKDGTRLATGQIQHLGYIADAIIWDISGLERDDLSTPKLLHKLQLHKVRVQALAFSTNAKYLSSIGGCDDNNLVIWNVESGKAVCGSPASHDVATTVTWLNLSETSLVTGGANHLRVWVSVYAADTQSVTGSSEMPTVFTAPIRDDLVQFCHSNMAKNRRQGHAVFWHAGHEHSAESWGTGRAVARIPRISGSGTHRSGQGAFGNMCRKGRMFAPLKIWRKWHRKVNVN